MSETVSTQAPEVVASEEERLQAILGLEDDDTDLSSDAEGSEQPEQGAAPSDDDQPETESADDEPQEGAAIDPPAFWAKEHKEHWANIPPATQAYLAERETQRDTEVRRSQQTAADARKVSEETANALAQERAYLAHHLVPALQEVNRRLQNDYSPAELAELARTNPAEWATRVAERDRMIEMHQTLAAEDARTRQIAVQGEMQRLVDKVPEWREPAVARQAMTSLVNLATEHGYTQQEIGQVGDHRAFLVLKSLHDKTAEVADLKAKLAKYEAAKTAPARKAVQPVVSRPVNAVRPRPDMGNRSMTRDQIMGAARSRNQADQIAALDEILRG